MGINEQIHGNGGEVGMSKVSVITCDACRREITGKPFEPDLCLTVVLDKSKIICHYCYDCAEKIIDSINKITAIERAKWISEKKGR